MSLCVVGALLLVGTLIVLIPNSPTVEIAVRQRHNPIAAPPQEQWASRSPQTLPETGTHNVAVQSIEWAQKASSVMATAIVSIPEKGADWIPADNWDHDWKQRLEPIRRDAHAAWDTLLENLPMPNPPST